MTSGNLKRKQEHQYQQASNFYLDSDSNNDINKKLKMIQSRQILMAFHLVTCGLQNNDLGRDETAILQIAFQLIDLSNNQVIGGKLILLQASSLLDPFANPDKIHISVPAREMTELLSSPNSYSSINLQEALNEVDNYINENVSFVDGENIEIIPVTIGHLPLRSVLHRETRFRSINLNSYWYHYYNICDEVSKFTNTSIQNMDEISEALQIDKPGVTITSIIWHMTTAILKLLQCGHGFQLMHIIKYGYKPIVFHVNDDIEPDVVVMIKPIDYRTPISQIIPFFRGLNIADGGIAVIMSEGRRSNKILVKFEDKIQRDIALLRDKHHMEPGNTRFITISVFDSQDFVKIAGYEDETVKSYLEKIHNQEQILIRIKGLPYTVTKSEILNFFASNEVEVQFSLDGIFLVQKPSGELNGDAFIIFENEIMAQKAKNLKGMTIGNRYMEIFYSTPPEMNQVIFMASKIHTKSKQVKSQTKTSEPQVQDIFKTSPKLDSIMSGTITKCIPIEATDNDFVKYLADYRGICLMISRSHLYCPPGFISYISVFKNSVDADIAIKALCDKPFRIESLNKEFIVKTVEFPLVTKLEERPVVYPQIVQKVYPNNLPISYLPTFQNILPCSPLQIPSTIHSISNPLNMPILNGSMLPYNALSNIYFGGQSIEMLPEANLYTLNQMPLSMSIGAATNFKLFQTQNVINNPFPPNNIWSEYRQTNPFLSTNLNKSKILLLYGVLTRLTQSDIDVIFHSIASNISMPPKLIQHNQYHYAVFSCLEDANIALQRCPIIVYNNQVIQLMPANE